jgi:hypothetical protein
MFAFAFVGIAAGGGTLPECELSGALSASGSTTIITGPVRTVTVPEANSGNIRFESVQNEGSGSVLYSKNGGAFTVLASNDVVNFSSADTDTLQMRATGVGVGQGGSARLVDVTSGQTIENVALDRTS